MTKADAMKRLAEIEKMHKLYSDYLIACESSMSENDRIKLSGELFRLEAEVKYINENIKCYSPRDTKEEFGIVPKQKRISTGVSFDPKRKLWRAYIREYGKNKHIGWYESEELALSNRKEFLNSRNVYEFNK